MTTDDANPTDPTPAPLAAGNARKPSRPLRWIRRIVLALLIVLLVAFGTGWWLLRGSLATLDGKLALQGLSAPVTVERDALGVVTIHAANENDALRALGYVHAQERFFEMDLMRRSASGQLAELFGAAAIDIDKKHRVHRFKARVIDHMDTIADGRMQQLQAYADGVNAGLADLKVRPWPYLLLRMKPEPWQVTDTPLVGYAMYFELQGGDNENELAMWRIGQHVPPALFALLARDGTSWDAPLEGEPRGDAVLPDAATLDLRKLPVPSATKAKQYADSMSAGSNDFAVGGARTKDGRAIVAGDMHLNLRVPDIWFRARLLYPDPKAQGGKVDIDGFTLPGIPAVVVGSNTHVAWAFTNSYGDWMDWVPDCAPTPVKACPPAGKAENVIDEQIFVHGASPVLMEVVERPEGTRRPDVAGAGAKLSLRWTAHVPGALTLGSMGMSTAKDRDAGIAVMNHAGIPAQNLLIGDREGHVAWTIAGRVPNDNIPGALHPRAPCELKPRIPVPAVLPSDLGHDTRRGAPSAIALRASCEGWPNGTLDPWMDANPSIRDPASGRLWSANNRVSDGDDLRAIGDSGYSNGARARQIRDDLFAKDTLSEKDLLAIQLDDRALFLTRWHTLLMDTAARTKDPHLAAVASAASHWDGRADPASVSYRVVRAWRLFVLSRVRDGLLGPAEAALGDAFIMPELSQFEGVAWPMVTQRPAHLLTPRFATWDALFADAAAQTQTELEQYGPLAQRSWGERNAAAICHPLARALPSLFKRWLCMPPDALPGDAYMPRVATPDFGASERMVVSPGHESDGIIEMPGGQSGNPLSPFWGAGHEAWVRGDPTPFLPGAPTHAMELLPPKH